MATGENAYSRGFLETWLRRCGERPWRWFIVIWLSLMLIWLIVGFVGFRHRTWENRPPPPEGIPYADHLPGGAQDYNGVLDLDASIVSSFDPKAALPNVNFQVLKETGLPNRLAAYVCTAGGRYGWPDWIVQWSSGTGWDVSDPARPFVEFVPRTWEWNPASNLDARGVYLSWRGDAPFSTIVVTIRWFEPMWTIIVMELFVAAIVVALRAAYAIRQRRRAHSGLCLECGHAHGPEPRPTRCPECGQAARAVIAKPLSRPARFINRPGRVFVALWVSMTLLWIAMSIIRGGQRDVGNLEERLADEVRINSNLAPAGQTVRQHLGVDIREYGWPKRVVSYWIIQTFEFAPGMAPVPAPRPSIEPGFHIGDDRDVQWVWRPADPTTSGMLTVEWSMTLLQLYGTHVMALVGASLVLLGLGIASRKRRSSPDQRST